MAHYCKGFLNESSDEITHSDPILVAKAAGFIKES